MPNRPAYCFVIVLWCIYLCLIQNKEWNYILRKDNRSYQSQNTMPLCHGSWDIRFLDLL